MKRLTAAIVFVLAVGVALVLTAGRGDTSAAQVPDVKVARLDGGEFSLTQLASADTPTLVWFWAPWCEVCNHEAPAIERLAHDAQGELAVVAIGGRDKAAHGPAFVARHGLRTPVVLFDEPMTVWQAYRIPGQPAAVLLDRDGHERQRWLGAFEPAEVLAATRAV